MAFFSIIIPVYNAEKYLGECLSSILGQNFSDYEVLLVDDGSKDNSPALCDQYAEKDKRVRVYHKANGGASDARNYGIRKVVGEFIIFMDADDFLIGENSLQILYDDMLKNGVVDCLCFNCSYYDSANRRFRAWPSFNDNMLRTLDHNEAMIGLVKLGSFPCSPCMKVLKTSFILNKEVFFKAGITAEDIPWFIDVLDNADSVRFIDLYAYAYRTNVIGSVTNTSNDYKSYNNLRKVVRNEVDKLADRSFTNDAKEALLSFLAYEYCIILGEVRLLPIDIREKEYKKLKEDAWLLKYTIHPKVKKVSILKSICGLRITSRFLQCYLVYMKASK